MNNFNLNILFAKIKFNQDGLIDAISETLTCNQVWYYSRSRQKLWRKGESSGQTQKLIQFLFDCDGDTLLLFVDQKGVACHTGRKSCFFNTWKMGIIEEVNTPLVDPKILYTKNS